MQGSLRLAMVVVVTDREPAVTEPSLIGRFFAAIGAVVEWYDLMLYGYLAVVFARVFFPADASPGVALAATLGGFAIGFLMRPIGGFFFGWLGDRHGRKLSLMVAITMMSIPMVGTALLPSYDAWGWAAPILLIFFRMVQGFSSGGEFSGTLVFLSEDATHGRRGRITSIATSFAGIGILLAALVAAILTTALHQDQLDAWGWRIAYAVGGLIIVVGIFMRSKMQETERYLAIQEDEMVRQRPLRIAMAKHWRKILIIGALAGYSGVVYFIVMTYLVSYLEGTVGIPHDTALVLTTVAAAIYAFSAYFFGWFTDRVGRKPPMMWSAVALVVISVPSFLMLNTANLAVISVAMFLLMLPLLFFSGAFYAAASELVPTRERNASIGIGYNTGIALLGSTAPVISQILINVTGVATIPSYYLVAASILIIPIIWKLPETAFKELDDY